MSTFVGVGSPGTVSSASGGKVYAYNAISTAASQVAPANPSRQRISFHNPGTINLYVAPTTALNAAGSAVTLTPTLGALGGTLLVFPGAIVVVEGECQGAWQALAASSSNNPMTVIDSNI